ncbi:MAG TPA: hypothetical protein PLR25_00105 [Planctomycetaceae bacterium]|nr:hypothetical protein [Planctomycetaceae bacterium]
MKIRPLAAMAPALKPARSRRIFTKIGIVLAMFAAALTGRVHGDDTSDAIAVLRSVQPGAVDSAKARKAVDQLTSTGAQALIPLLHGCRDASPLAENWLRNAFEQIVDQETKAGQKLPQQGLEAFVKDQNQSPSARRLVYETLKRSDAGIEDRLIPKMLLDSSPEFRRDAVARLIGEASEVTDATKATALYRQAFSGAVHEDQVKIISDALRKQGEQVDVQTHFGFLSEWSIVGPFDNREEKGLAIAYGPELDIESGKAPDPQAEYDGQLSKVRWQAITTKDDYGVVDIAKQIENYKGSLMYAMTIWKSDKDQQVEVRLGTPNSWKLWVNGKLVFEREEYHRNSLLDQYRVPVLMKAGANTLMLKICQNEQPQDWAQRYQFQMRICTSTGSAIKPSTSTARNETRSGVQP